MNRLLALLMVGFSGLLSAETELRNDLENSYEAWRGSIIRRDAKAWQLATAPHRRMEVRNRILAEKRDFPASVFDLPAPPPGLTGLKFLEATRKGATAKAAYFGKVDFGVGGEPSENLLMLSFVAGERGWLYDRAEFINLTALPAVRGELAAGNLSYLKENPEAQASGEVPITPPAAPMAKYIAKVYVFCPGREVRLQVNQISHHRFANAKEAEIVIGGARDGLNEVQYAIRKLDGGTGREAMTIRVYLMSETPGVKPIKIFEYQVDENQSAEPFGTGRFVVNAATVEKLRGR